MNLRNLRYFAEIAEPASVSQANLRRDRSQPALSESVHDLELELELAFQAPGLRPHIALEIRQAGNMKVTRRS